MKYFFTLFLLFALTILSSAQNFVTLLVNMSEQTISPDGVHVAGSFQEWNPSTTALDDMGGGIYGVTFEVAENTEIQFKFINGIDWPFQEPVPAECGVNDGFGGFNRSFSIGSTDATFGPVCFGECADCGIVVEPETVMVLFQVNMSNETISPQGVHLAGNFQGWNPNATVLTDLGGGNFEILYEVPANQTAEFRFINGSEWINAEVVPSECGVENGFGEYIRTFEVGSENAVFGPVCFGECANCQPTIPVMVIFQVDMTNETVSPDGVFVAGNFNGWDATATSLAPNGDGTYQAVAFVDSGSELQYKFINGGDWAGAENIPSSCGVDDGSGNVNRVIQVENSAITTPLVCFGTCAPCEFIPVVNVTFVVNMSLVSVDPNGVHIAGTFNDFSSSSSQMTNLGNGLYSYTATVGQNQQIFYKFINGNDFANVEQVPFECGQNDGFGGYNRTVVTNDQDFTVNTVCFGSCADCLVSVAELNSEMASIFPNPAVESINIVGFQNEKLNVINALGQVVMVLPKNHASMIYIGNLAQGQYLIKSEKGQKVGVFIKK